MVLKRRLKNRLEVTGRSTLAVVVALALTLSLGATSAIAVSVGELSGEETSTPIQTPDQNVTSQDTPEIVESSPESDLATPEPETPAAPQANTPSELSAVAEPQAAASQHPGYIFNPGTGQLLIYEPQGTSDWRKSVDNPSGVDPSDVLSVIIPEGMPVTEVTDGAFKDCPNLETVELLSFGIAKIGASAFENDVSLRNLVIPARVTKIGAHAFDGIPQIGTINIENVVPPTLGENALGDATNDLNIIVPSYGIDDYKNDPLWAAYHGNIATKKVETDSFTFDPATGTLKVLQDRGVYRWRGVSGISPDKEAIRPEHITKLEFSPNVKAINDFTPSVGAFEGIAITDLVLPNTIVSGVPGNTFRNCKQLKTAVVDCGYADPGVPVNYTGRLGAELFAGCESLESLVIGSQMTEIDRNFISGCSSLTTLDIPQNITYLNRMVFEGSSLTRLNVLAGSTLATSSTTFEGFPADAEIVVPVDAFNYFYYDDSWRNVRDGMLADEPGYTFSDGVLTITSDYGSTIWREGKNALDPNQVTRVVVESGVTVIGSEFDGVKAFENCVNMKSMQLPTSLKTIQKYTFRNCTGLDSVTLPEGLETIGDSAFNNLASLITTSKKPLVIPASVKSIGNQAFGQCYELRDVSMKSLEPPTLGAEVFTARLGNVTVPYVAPYTAVAKYREAEGWRDLKGSYDYVIVGEEIMTDDYSFVPRYGYLTLRTNQGVSGWVGKVNPTDILTIDFESTLGQDIKLDKKADGTGLFEGTSVTWVSIPSNVVEIGESAFKNSKSLGEVYIKSTSGKIGKDAFSGCEKLTLVEISSGITSIEEGAFAGCNVLATANIPDSVTSIGDRAFEDTALSSVTLSANVDTIGEGAFSGVTSFTVYGNDPAAIQQHALGDTTKPMPDDFVINVPMNEVANYQQAWPEYTSYIRPNCTWSVIEGDGGVYTLGSNTDLMFKIDAPHGSVASVSIDDVVLDKENYTITKGSTIVGLKAAHLETHTVDAHVVKVTYKSGEEVSANFSVAAPGPGPGPTPGPEPKPNPGGGTGDAPKLLVSTGDPLSLAPFAAMGVVAIVGLVLALSRKKSGQR